MARDNNLMRRGAVYYARIYTPKDLIEVMGGKSEIWRSLRTSDYAEAKLRKAVAVGESAERFERLRRRGTPEANVIQSMIWDHYLGGVLAGDQERSEWPTREEYDTALDKAFVDARASGAADIGGYAMINAMADVELLVGKPIWAADRRARRLVALREHLASGETRLVEAAVDAGMTKRGLVVAKGSADYRDLCLRFMRSEVEFLKRTAERDAGDFTGAPLDPLIVPPAEITAAGESLGVMSIFSKYESENPNNIRVESFRQARRDVQHFVDFTGTGVPAREVSKRHVREWKEALMLYPVKASETTVFKGLSIVEVINANKKAGKPTLSRQTVRRYMSSLGGLCRWMVTHDYLEANPVIDMLPKRSATGNQKPVFTDEQLLVLFSSTLFAGCRGPTWRDASEPGKHLIRDHRFWMPWIMMFSGARLGEVAQLLVADIRVEHDIAIMHITEQGGHGKRTKTKGSMRSVPVHSELLKLGLLEFRDVAASSGQVRLFPEVAIPSDGQIAAQFSREFGRYLERLGMKSGRGLSAHSFRHGFVDKARKAGFTDDEIALVVGHDKPTMTGRYGTERQGTLAFRQRIVESVLFPTRR